MTQLSLEKLEPEMAITPMGVLQMAVSQGADIDKLTKLMDLQERWEANEARKAYYAAMKRFKENPPVITKNGTGHNNAKYATLDHACAQIIPALSKVGITHKWSIQAKNGKVTVSCVLSHELGFSEPDPPTIEADADTTGSKNAIQGLGSSIKYLERYTLFAAAGMDDGAKDVDGAGTELPQEQVGERLNWMKEARDAEELQKTFAAAYKIAAAAGATKTMAEYIKARDKRRLELNAKG